MPGDEPTLVLDYAVPRSTLISHIARARELVYIAVFSLLSLRLPPDGTYPIRATADELLMHSKTVAAEERSRQAGNELQRRIHIRDRLPGPSPDVYRPIYTLKYAPAVARGVVVSIFFTTIIAAVLAAVSMLRFERRKEILRIACRLLGAVSIICGFIALIFSVERSAGAAIWLFALVHILVGIRAAVLSRKIPS